jgi:5-(carboxyamino)imidazole ribonucleotide mutase
MEKARIAIIMGSSSDLPVMKPAAEICEKFQVPFEITIVSAHRTPERMFEYAKSARSRGIEVIIAGAGGAAHLPGMVASLTTLPVIGVPVKSSNSIDGWDSVLSILQMPAGIPVATVALNGAANAGLLAVRILGSNDTILASKLGAYQQELESKVMGTLNEPERLGLTFQRKSTI